MIIEGYKEKWKNQVAYLRTFDENIAEDFIEDFIWELLEIEAKISALEDKQRKLMEAE